MTSELARIAWSPGDSWILVAVVALIFASAVLALAETGLTRTSRARAKALEDSGARGAKSLRRLVDQPERFLAPVLLLVLCCQLVAATLVGVIAAHVFGALGVAVATLFEVVVIFLFGEAVPKQWAVRNTDRAALLAAPIVSAFVRFPPVRVLSSGLIGIARFLTPGGRRPHKGSDVTESELLAFTDVAVEEEAIESDERELIHSIIEFGDTIVREVMVPRPDIVAFEASTLAEPVLEGAIAVGFSRLPVYEGNIDNVVGIAFTKDLVLAVRRGQADRPVGEIARAPHFVPETKRVAPLLREMQRERFHLAIVVDEYGGTAGIVSLEDLIEELVGEISDEYDVVEPTVVPLEDGRFRVPSIMPVDEVNDLLGAELPLGDDWDTIGGLMMAQAGHIPSEDEEIEVDGYRLVAGNVRGQRIGSVTVEALEKRPALHLEEHIPAALVVDSAPAPAAEPAEPSAPSAPSAPSSLDVETDGRAIAGASDRPEERLDAKADARADE
ncbi:MAG TPA: hemolysin family protein [Acidimicrobiales bacterium]|nr:hemolysin family protein [Acidimicrobiales bacterium]